MDKIISFNSTAEKSTYTYTYTSDNYTKFSFRYNLVSFPKTLLNLFSLIDNALRSVHQANLHNLDIRLNLLFMH
jgi:hypothetical protein